MDEINKVKAAIVSLQEVVDTLQAAYDASVQANATVGQSAEAAPAPVEPANEQPAQ